MAPTDQQPAKHVWLSYPEAVKTLGISLRAVEGRAYRGKWAKQRGNDGTVRLAVPRREIEAHEPHETHGTNPTDDPTIPHEWFHEGHTIKALERELETVREALLRERERGDRAIVERDAAQTGQAAAMVEAAAERSRAEAASVRAAAAEGKLEGLTSGTTLLHEQLAQMRREVAEAHNRAVAAEQLVLDAVRQRDGAEQALARARSWNFLNFLFGREGKGRQP